MPYSRAVAAGLLAILTLEARSADQTFAGTISDSMCAMDHTSMRMGPTDAECTQACIEEHDATYAPEIRQEMIKRANGRSTFPQIFIGERHVGGCDDLHALERAGELDALLAA